MRADADAVRRYAHDVFRPMIQADGGDVACDPLADGRARLRFRGDSSRCTATGCRLVPWNASMIERECGARIEIDAVMDRPYSYR
jgi:Fe-S cluster biogenesis protein NfuA